MSFVVFSVRFDRLRKHSSTFFFLAACIGFAAPSVAQDETAEFSAAQLEAMQRYDAIKWTDGPTTGQIGSLAQIELPAGYRFTDAKGAQDLLELYGNPRNPDMLGAIEPLSDEEDWTLVFQFSDIGYVDDSDRDSLDAGEIMDSFKAGIPSGNAERRRLGLEEMDDMSWQEQPFYDPQTNNLTWALKLDFPNGSSINYDIRMLGRKGVMEVTLIGDPETYSQAVPTVKKILSGYQFTSGNKYAEWKQGDKIAAVGLAGLVAGGAAIAAAKTGLFAKLGVMLAKGGKAIVLGIVVVFGAVGSFFKKMLGGGKAAD